MLRLTPDHLQTLHHHAERTYPEECCGILLGAIQQQADQPHKTLVDLIETENAWSEAVAAELESVGIASSRHASTAARRDRYWIDPQMLLQAQKQARDRGLQIIGIYHSHPDHPAMPSETDRLLAWAEYSYIILSVQQGKVAETRSWSLDEHHQFREEKLVVR
ncbi:M67 family metallopeptidase [Leptolyngbya sp. NK1-12]|uniref:M67 family metallopeptidase n=1 Tax=Leptolyngbya sp. NK1-12 TaxID=2547451 RepID=A0AA96WBH8_9CYAN|nr:M67 family metallopeptidase [Leptolyngbya sp. NK1-12]WNZ22018.1 M67 family metallopeptidase [Leptolyngbya sp. NK1-12]